MTLRIGVNSLFGAGNFPPSVSGGKPSVEQNAAFASKTPIASLNPNEAFAQRRGIDSVLQKRFALQNQFSAAQTLTDPKQPVFKTVGGTWRKDSEGTPRFYRAGANTAGTTRFDQEYYHPDAQKYPEAGGKCIRLNAKGGQHDLPENTNKARPAEVSDFDWKGFEWVEEKNVPADYATSDKIIAFAEPKNAENQLTALKRYVVENNLAPGVWDEAKFSNIFSSQARTDIKLNLEKAGEADGKTVFKVQIDPEGLAKLRTGLEQYRQEIGSDAAGGTESGKEELRLATDTAGLYYETTRKVVDGTINAAADSLNAVLFPPFSQRTGAEPNFGRAKVGEMYDELASREITPSNGQGPLPRLETTPLKYEFQSELMRRGVFTGKVDEGIKMGDAVTTATSIAAPLAIGKAIIPFEVPQTLEKLGGIPSFRVKQGKWDYFFDRGIKSDPHNIPRSAQNKANLEQLGIYDDAKGTNKMLDVFNQGLKLPAKSTHKSPYGVTVTKHVKVSDVGGIDVKYFYPKGNLSAKPQISSMIPKIYK